VNCHSCHPRHHGDSDQEDKRLDARLCHCHPPPDKLRAESTPWSALPSQQVWPLSDIRRDSPRLCRTTRHWDFADKLRLTRQHFLEFRCFAPTNYPPLLASPAFRFQCVRLSLFARIQRREPHTRCIHALAVPKIKAPVSATPGACYSRPVHPKPIRPKTAYDRMGVRSVKSVQGGGKRRAVTERR
jgi:hypothetical protein